MSALDYRPTPGTIPTGPGVYRFRDPHGQVIYVGKAKNLRSRVQSYFQDVAALHPRTQLMVTTAASIDWTLVRTEVEALVLEHSWIKQYDPRFNVVFKDDKSYPYLAVTMKDDVPRIHVIRGARKAGVRYFGPYARAWAIRETVDALLTVLPMRSCGNATFAKAARQGRPCLLGYIDKCAAPCVGRIGVDEHRELAERVCAVLGGDAKQVVRELTNQMDAAAQREDYEAAGRARDRLRALNDILDRNAVVLDSSANADIFSLVNEDLQAAAHVFHVRQGRIVGEHGWIIDKPEPLDDASMVTQLLQEAYSAAEPLDIPGEILVSTVPDDQVHVTEWLSGLRGSRIAIKIAQRGKKAELASTGLSNAAEVLTQHRLKRASDLTSRSKALQELGELLGMPHAPLRIECYDISHLQGTNQVGSMVVFEDAVPKKRAYRTFSVPDGMDDLAAMRHVLERRLGRLIKERELPLDERESSSFAYPPQLIVVDGGPAQVAVAAQVCEQLALDDVWVVGLAKRLEELWLPGQDHPAIAPRGSEALFLLQRVRDEAHRFAISKHRRKRTKVLTASEIDAVAGIGPKRATALLRHFGSVARMMEASVDQIALVPGVGEHTARAIYNALHP